MRFAIVLGAAALAGCSTNSAPDARADTLDEFKAAILAPGNAGIAAVGDERLRNAIRRGRMDRAWRHAAAALLRNEFASMAAAHPGYDDLMERLRKRSQALGFRTAGEAMGWVHGVAGAEVGPPAARYLAESEALFLAAGTAVVGSPPWSGERLATLRSRNALRWPVEGLGQRLRTDWGVLMGATLLHIGDSQQAYGVRTGNDGGVRVSVPESTAEVRPLLEVLGVAQGIRRGDALARFPARGRAIGALFAWEARARARRRGEAGGAEPALAEMLEGRCLAAIALFEARALETAQEEPEAARLAALGETLRLADGAPFPVAECSPALGPIPGEAAAILAARWTGYQLRAILLRRFGEHWMSEPGALAVLASWTKSGLPDEASLEFPIDDVLAELAQVMADDAPIEAPRDAPQQ